MTHLVRLSHLRAFPDTSDVKKWDRDRPCSRLPPLANFLFDAVLSLLFLANRCNFSFWCFLNQWHDFLATLSFTFKYPRTVPLFAPPYDCHNPKANRYNSPKSRILLQRDNPLQDIAYILHQDTSHLPHPNPSPITTENTKAATVATMRIVKAHLTSNPVCGTPAFLLH